MVANAIAGWMMLAATCGSPVAEEPEPAPSLGLLLHLGEFEDADGEHLDPLDLPVDLDLHEAEAPVTESPSSELRRPR